jgi:exopolyphosphatase/guanosine-5'-triphosphate,3'-diphosphate pyrophosphatase
MMTFATGFPPASKAARPDRGPTPGGRSAPVYGALDLGTNNCRLLLAVPEGAGDPAPAGHDGALAAPLAAPPAVASGRPMFRVIDAFSRIVRLGEGLGQSGVLSEAAMIRTIGALRVCAGKLRRHRVAAARLVATEACRRAANCEDFLARVRRETGLAIEIITTEDEARLALAGCAPLLEAGRPHALVFDIGGGSTELSWLAVDGAATPEPIDITSVPLGVVTLGEHYGGDQVSPAAYEAMVAEVARAIGPFEQRHAIGARVAAGAVQMLGTSGTVTTLAGIHLDLPRYDRAVVDGSYLSFASVAAVTQRLAALDYERRAAHPCIGRERADLVLAGCAILDAICRQWPVGRLRVADRGVREGILCGLMRRDGFGRSRPVAQELGAQELTTPELAVAGPAQVESARVEPVMVEPAN